MGVKSIFALYPQQIGRGFAINSQCELNNHRSHLIQIFLLVLIITGSVQSVSGYQPRHKERTLRDRYVDMVQEDRDEAGLEPDIVPSIRGEYTLSISVLDAKNKKPQPGVTIDGAPVMFAPESDLFDLVYPAGEFIVGNLESLVADESGKAVYEKIGSGRFFLEVHGGQLVGSQVIEVQSEDVEVEILLQEPASVEGVLVDAVTGKPLSNQTHNLEVSFERRDGVQGQSENTAAGGSGRFHVDGLAPGKWECRIWVHGKDEDAYHLLGETKQRQDADIQYYSTPDVIVLELSPGEDISLGNIEIPRVPEIEIEVVDESGKPVADLSVEYEVGSTASSYHKYLDENGRVSFVLAGYDRGGYFAVFLPETMEDEYRTEIPGRNEYSPLADFDEAEARQRFRNHLPRDIDQDELKNMEKEYISRMKKMVEQFENRPQHPNAHVFFPKPGEQSKHLITYKPVLNETSIAIRAVDADSEEAVEGFHGRVNFYSPEASLAFLMGEEDTMMDVFRTESLPPSMRFHSANSGGVAEISHFFFPSSSDSLFSVMVPQKSEQSVPVYIAIGAEGYVREMFSIAASELREKKEFTAKLTPEGIIRGRVLNAATNESFIQEELKNIWDEKHLARGHGYMSPGAGVMLAQAGRFGAAPSSPSEIISVSLGHENPKGIETEGVLLPRPVPVVSPVFLVHPDEEGYFEIRGVNPDEDWKLEVSLPGYPTVSREIDVASGVNDVGIIELEK